MNKRLVWNFEINSDSPLTLPDVDEALIDNTHWESRFFWPEQDTITLSNLDDHYLELSRYKIKHHTDVYFLLPDADYNLKTRKNELTYKPLIHRTKTALAYDKKIKLETCIGDVPGFNQERLEPLALIQRAKHQGQPIQVDKEALRYQFKSHPSTQFELARLMTNGAVYFSLSFESPHLAVVEALTHQIIPHSIPCDYVAFLKKRLTP